MKQRSKNIMIVLAIIIALITIYILFFNKKTDPFMPGSDRDEHGCIGSAGYTWCEIKQKCLRTWEESCE